MGYVFSHCYRWEEIGKRHISTTKKRKQKPSMTVSIPLSILSTASDQPSSHFNAVSPVSSYLAPDECVLPTINLSGLTSSLSSQSLYHNSLESPNSSLLSTGESFILPTCETVFVPISSSQSLTSSLQKVDSHASSLLSTGESFISPTSCESILIPTSSRSLTSTVDSHTFLLDQCLCDIDQELKNLLLDKIIQGYVALRGHACLCCPVDGRAQEEDKIVSGKDKKLQEQTTIFNMTIMIFIFMYT